VFKDFVPCPVCYDIGGGGVIERFILTTDNSVLYTCDECSATWGGEDRILLGNYRVLSEYLANKGFQHNDYTHIKKQFDPKTFLASGDELTDLIEKAFERHGKSRESSPAHLSIWKVDMGEPVGKKGEKNIVIVLNTTENSVLDAHTED
jgi:hypothetical protein